MVMDIYARNGREGMLSFQEDLVKSMSLSQPNLLHGLTNDDGTGSLSVSGERIQRRRSRSAQLEHRPRRRLSGFAFSSLAVLSKALFQKLLGSMLQSAQVVDRQRDFGWLLDVDS